jgi:DNA-binding CsgD family transcriptional regulator
LATLVATTEERARHLALATTKPDHDIASTLEETARSAHARGAPVAAAELAEHALRLTPPGEKAAGRRRLFLAAERYFFAGDIDRATVMLETARATAVPGKDRAAILAQLARVTTSARGAVSLYRQALAEAEDDDTLQAEIHLSLASLMRFSEGVERGIEHGELAVRAAERVGDIALRCRAFAAYGLLHFNGGRGIPRAEMEEALRLERSLDEWPLVDGPASVYGHQLWWSAEVDPARTLFEEVHDAVCARNDPVGEAEALWCLGMVEWRAGNWERSDRCAARSLELTTQLGTVTPPAQFPVAVITAHLGRIDEARALAERAVARAETEGMGAAMSGFSWVLGFIELSLGSPVAALPHLRRGYAHRGDFILEPGMRLEVGDLLEALVATGELDEADTVLAREESRASALDRAWALAILARCRALLLAARGDQEGAFAAFEQALAQHARTTDPFHHARTLLALGRTQRRAKRRGDARRTLEDALASFETLGAPLWAEQTRAELARIGGRAPSRGALTEAESRIARLVAEGHTNREVAAALFLTEHSVETALTRVYRKLGVRSRSELAHSLASNS